MKALIICKIDSVPLGTEYEKANGKVRSSALQTQTRNVDEKRGLAQRKITSKFLMSL